LKKRTGLMQGGCRRRDINKEFFSRQYMKAIVYESFTIPFPREETERKEKAGHLKMPGGEGRPKREEKTPEGLYKERTFKVGRPRQDEGTYK